MHINACVIGELSERKEGASAAFQRKMARCGGLCTYHKPLWAVEPLGGARGVVLRLRDLEVALTVDRVGAPERTIQIL